MSLVLQDSLASLNPVKTIGSQIAEMFTSHLGMSAREANRRSVELLRLVGIPSPADRFRHYPHQFSGGMRQRAMIAVAIALNPALLIADEPTTALDVTVQAQIIELLMELQESRRMAIVIITHDIALASAVSDRIAVMYAGRIIETGPTHDVLDRPAHPYTAALLESNPRADGGTLQSISGEPPDPASLPIGCAFNPRCQYAVDICRTNDPNDRQVSSTRSSSCHRYLEVLSR